ncbi:MAG: DUF4936 family protein [Zoogloeaceae bacterium]|nr:DUF4936 family protein [Zoogloeaceae bacterium]
MVDLYIYYCVGDVDAAIPRVHAMQAAVAARTGIQGRLMRRRDDDNTLMEIYPGIADTMVFEALLAEEVTAHSLESLVSPGAARHTERFTCA